MLSLCHGEQQPALSSAGVLLGVPGEAISIPPGVLGAGGMVLGRISPISAPRDWQEMVLLLLSSL